MDLRDAAALFIIFGSFIASSIVEAVCGAETEHCALKWSVFDDVNVDSYHCAPRNENKGLGDPSLTVSSLMLVAVLPYLYIDDRFNALPILGSFLGIASFLFHARPTELHHRMDVTGCTLLAPALADAAAAAKSASKPILDLGQPSQMLRLMALIPPIVVVSIVHPTSPTWIPLWTITIIYGLFFLMQVVRIYPRKVGVDIFAADSIFYPLAFLVAGIITLLVGNMEKYWICVPSQFGEPHIWGHVFIAAGSVVVARKNSAETSYDVSEVAESLLGTGVSLEKNGCTIHFGVVGVILCISAAAVFHLNKITAVVLAIVAIGLHILSIVCKTEGESRYSKKCTYRNRHIGIDTAAVVSLATGIAALSVESATRDLAIVSLSAAFVTTTFESADPGNCNDSRSGPKYLR